MKVKIGREQVEVLDRLCAKRSCFVRGEDKGTFVQGRGYTSYYDKPRIVCWTRHLRGCPTAFICPAPDCRLCHVEQSTACSRCGGQLVPYPEPRNTDA